MMVTSCSLIKDDARHRVVSIRPQYALGWSLQSCDVQQCAEDALIRSQGCNLAGIVSGCGQDAADIALAACKHLAEVLQAKEQHPLAPQDLVGAFEQCHARLLQQAAQQPQPHHHPKEHEHPHQQQQRLNVSHSGASCLLVCIDPAKKQLLAASAGLCHAVMARAAPAGALTVLELSPRLALGYNVAETSRLDAEGSRICYSCRVMSPQQGDSTTSRSQQAAAASGQGQLPWGAQQQVQQQQQQASCPEPVLIGPDGQAHAGVRASRLLGYSSASSAGVTATPVVTSWRLSGEEAFVVLGSPGLWAAMNPAEVVDYIAAALASGACSSSMEPGGTDDAASSPAQLQDQQRWQPDAAAAAAAAALRPDAASNPAQQQDQLDAAAATAAGAAAMLRPDAAVLLSDLLTLEAQERLKLRLSDISKLLGLGGTAAAAAGVSGGGGGCHQVVPDVTAVVLLLSGPLPQQKGVQDRMLLQQELACVTRGCRSNAEAQALQASWYSSAAASACSSTTSITAPSSSSSSSIAAASASMSSSADSTCSTGTSAISAACSTPDPNSSSTRRAAPDAAVCCPTAVAGLQAAAAAAGAGALRGCPAAEPAAPALSCLLPALTVAGHCWPATFWPAAEAAVSAPAALTHRKSLGAAAAADGADCTADSAATAAAAAGPPGVVSSRPVGFTLSPRLSIELDVTHRPGSSGTSSGLLAAQCAAADAAGSLPDQLPSPSSAAEEQAVIVHKIRLSGPNELESLLFGSATTAYPDTTVARILKPKPSNALEHAYSWAAPGGVNTSGFGCSSSSSSGGAGARQQHRPNGWASGGGWSAGGWARPVHAAPRRSASVNIAQLSRQLHGGGTASFSSSTASSQHSQASSLRGATGSGSFGRAFGGDSLAGAAATRSRSQRSSLEGIEEQAMPSLSSAAARASTSSAAASSTGQRQLARVPELGAHGAPGMHIQQAVSLPAGASSTGRVSKARSYQALSALQAADSAEKADSLAAAAAAAALPAVGVSAEGTQRLGAGSRVAAASADAAFGLGSRSSGGGLFPSGQQLHFRPAFRSALHSSAAAAFQQSLSGGILMPAQQQQQQQQQGLQQQQQASPSLRAASADAQGSGLLSRSSSAAQQLCGPDGVQEVPEGKVRGGLSRSRSGSIQALSSGEATGVEPNSAGLMLGEMAPTAAAAAAAAPEAGVPVSSTEQQGAKAEPSVRGGHTRAARMKHSLSNPELNSLAPGTKTRARRVSALLPPAATYTSSTAAAAAAAGTSAISMQAGASSGGSRIRGGSLPPTLQLSNSLAGCSVSAGGTISNASTAVLSPFAQDGAGSNLAVPAFVPPHHQQQQQAVPAFCSAFAGASGAVLSPAGSRELSVEGCMGADSAVHGGELGEQALEGQMHGGRRSKSMSVGSLLVTSSAPSSAEDNDDTLTATLSPGSRQQQHSWRMSGPNNSANSSLSCSSSRQLLLSPAGSGALQCAPQSSHGSYLEGSAAAGAAGAACVPGATASPAYGSMSLTRSCSLAEASFSSAGGLQAFASHDGPLELLLAGSSGGGAGNSGSIEVVRTAHGMASCSFTKVRFAASAPAGVLGCEQLSSAVDGSADCCSPSMLAGALQHSSAAGACSSYSSRGADVLASQQGPGCTGSSSGSLGTAAVRGWSSPNRHVVAFSSSAGSSDGAALRSSSSMPGGSTGPDLGMSSQPPAAPKPAWSSSRAWGGKPTARQLSTSINLFARPSASTPGGPAPTPCESPAGAAATAEAGQGYLGGKLPQAAGVSSNTTADGVVSTPARMDLQGSDLSCQSGSTGGECQDGTGVQVQAAVPSTKRQRSAPLPTLQESPACTPGASPDASFGFAAAYEETLARHLGQHKQRDVQQRGLPGLLLLGHDDDMHGSCCAPLSGSSAQAAQQQQLLQLPGSFAEHSATGLVMQSLTAEANRRSLDESGSSRGAPVCSSESLSVDVRGGLASDSFEFSRPHQGEGAGDPHSPLLGKSYLQG